MHARSGARALGWTALALVSGLGWFATGRGLAFRAGFEDAAPGLGFALAATVVVTLWRWERQDAARAALERFECPSCGSRAEVSEAGASGSSRLRTWACAACGWSALER